VLEQEDEQRKSSVIGQGWSGSRIQESKVSGRLRSRRHSGMCKAKLLLVFAAIEIWMAEATTQSRATESIHEYHFDCQGSRSPAVDVVKSGAGSLPATAGCITTATPGGVATCSSVTRRSSTTGIGTPGAAAGITAVLGDRSLATLYMLTWRPSRGLDR
jgi:hypothetical protein